tara:strand:+ start:5069 stop:5491 length:423 start_codon:yes stop_codon:yes gene_type:complete
MSQIILPNNWTPRGYQIPVMAYLDGGGKRAVSLWHRRAGKDSAGLNYAAKEMFRRPGVYWHLLPSQRQARKVVWNNVDRQGRRMIDQAFPEQLFAVVEAAPLPPDMRARMTREIELSSRFQTARKEAEASPFDWLGATLK